MHVLLCITTLDNPSSSFIRRRFDKYLNYTTKFQNVLLFVLLNQNHLTFYLLLGLLCTDRWFLKTGCLRSWPLHLTFSLELFYSRFTRTSLLRSVCMWIHLHMLSERLLAASCSATIQPLHASMSSLKQITLRKSVHGLCLMNLRSFSDKVPSFDMVKQKVILCAQMSHILLIKNQA